MTLDPIEDLFRRLDAWRHLPAYQLERRADIFFAVYLREIMEKHCAVSLEEEVIPELPLRVDLVFPGRTENLSVKVDYVFFARDRSRVFFVELKTDSASRRTKQDAYLLAAKDVGFRRVVDGIRQLALRTKAHQKYHHLLHRLAVLGFLRMPADIEDHLYPAPTRGLRKRLRAIELTEADAPIEVLFVQPTATPGEPCIDFAEVARHVRLHEDPFSQAFAAHLERWVSAAGATPPGQATATAPNTIAVILEEKARFVPKTGFNVVGLDTFEPPGEALYLVGHYDTREEAERVRDQRARESSDRYFIYDPENH